MHEMQAHKKQLDKYKYKQRCKHQIKQWQIINIH
jgi:hypothetical protein